MLSSPLEEFYKAQFSVEKQPPLARSPRQADHVFKRKWLKGLRKYFAKSCDRLAKLATKNAWAAPQCEFRLIFWRATCLSTGPQACRGTPRSIFSFLSACSTQNPQWQNRVPSLLLQPVRVPNRRSSSTVRARTPNIRCAITFAAPLTPTKRPPNSSLIRAFTRSTIVRSR